jgi:hypothetical protein
MGNMPGETIMSYAIFHMRHILGANKIGFGDGISALFLAAFVSILPIIVTVVTVGNKIALCVTLMTLIVIAATLQLDSAWRNLKVGIAAWMGLSAVMLMAQIL